MESNGFFFQIIVFTKSSNNIYHLIFFNEACNEGWYGKDCALKCGHCLGPEPCHLINGSCPRGCQEGYTGENCSTCKRFFFNKCYC